MWNSLSSSYQLYEEKEKEENKEIYGHTLVAYEASIIVLKSLRLREERQQQQQQQNNKNKEKTTNPVRLGEGNVKMINIKWVWGERHLCDNTFTI